MMNPARRPVFAATLAIAAWMATAGLPAQAADTTPAAPVSAAKADPLGAARALIAENKWRAAIDELQRTPQPDNADWNNLMGYSHRKAKTPDYAAAERYYDAALRVDPKHRGALEYSGELYLMMGDLPRAEQRLAALDKVCLLPCAEYTDLKAAIAAFKANGNRHAARP